MSSAVHLRTISEIARGGASAFDTVRSAMAAIVNGESGPARLNAFISYDYEAAIAQAERVDADRAGGARGASGAGDAAHGGRGHRPLAGVPIAVKDNICTLGLATTCASRILAGYRSPYEATVVRRLRDAGAVIAGKTNLDEFAMGSSTETSALGPAHNPHDRARVPGGSSGGSAAAVAAGMVPCALGTDTGGSVRQPAAFCGVVGVRPTWGRVSRYGVVAFASSLDQVGVLARSVDDAAEVLRVIGGPDPFDATCTDAPVIANARVATECTPVVGVPVEYFSGDLHPGVRAACERAIEALRSAGCTIREVSLPHTGLGVAVYTVIAAAEASTNLARFDGVRFGARRPDTDIYSGIRTAGFGEEVRRRIVLGTYILSSSDGRRHHAAAQRVRQLITQDFLNAFANGVDVLFTPTTGTPAFGLGAARAPYDMYAEDALTAPASLAGVPAMSVPIGTADGLPVGGQVIAPPWHEDAMFAVARMIEAGLAT